MNGFINDKVLPPMMRFVNTKAMTALKNGILYAMPFIIIGSIFLILNNIPYTPVATAITNSGWGAVLSQAYQATFGILAIWACVGIGYCYMQAEGLHDMALPAGLTGLASFFILQSFTIANPITAGVVVGKTTYSLAEVTAQVDKIPHFGSALTSMINSPVAGVLNFTWNGGEGMIAAILVGCFTGWGYSAMVKAGWKFTLPEQVPENVANQFTAMIPSFVVIVVATAIFAFFDFVLKTNFLQQVYTWLEQPLQHVGDSYIGIIIVALLVPFFWFFGVHGGVIMGAVTGAFLIPNSAANAILTQKHMDTLANGAHIVTNEFYNNFINLTGSGITFGLVIFTLFFAKSETMKSLGKIEVVPGLFNINEPFLFGIPLVLNPVMALPFFLTPVVVSTTVYIAIATGICPPLSGVAAPWTTPPIISGFLIGGWQFALLQLIALVESTLIYFPFARKYDKTLLDQEAEDAKAEEEAAASANAQA